MTFYTLAVDTEDGDTLYYGSHGWQHFLSDASYFRFKASAIREARKQIKADGNTTSTYRVIDNLGNTVEKIRPIKRGK